MSLLRLAPYRDIAAAVADRLRNDPKTEVLVASAGVAGAIADALIARHPEGAIGLRLDTIETFAKRVVNAAGDLPRVAPDRERRLAMRMAARSIDEPVMESRGIAAMLDRSLRDVRDGGLTLAEFESRARGARRLRNAERTQLVIRAWREYERLIGQLGAIDPSDLLRRAAIIIESGRVTIAPQIVAGFYDMTGAQRRVVDAIRAAGKLEEVHVPAGDDEAYAFARPFIEAFETDAVPRSSSGSSDSRPRNSEELRGTPRNRGTVQYDTAATEHRETCRAIAALLRDGVAANDIGIVARSLQPYDIALINRFAAEEGFDTSAPDEVPLIAHRLGRGIATLLRLRDDNYPRTAVIELLRDGFEPKRRVDVDELDLATRRARIAGGTSSSLTPLIRNAAIEAYVSVVAELESLASAGLAALLERFRIDTAHDLAAAELIDEIATTFTRAAKWNRAFDAQTIIDAISHEQLRLRDEQPRPTVFLGDVMRFRGHTFNHLFVIRMQDDVFPQRRIDDPLLPDHDRQLLGVRMIGDGKEEERMLFQLLLDAAENVHFSYATSDGFAKVLRPSPLLRPFARAAAAVPINEPPRAHAAERQLQLLAKSGTRSPFDGYLFAAADDDALREKLTNALSSVSPTHLEDFGECPQKFLLKQILGVRDLDDPEHELQINARDKGKVDHGILERFYRQLTDEEFARAAAALPQLEADIAARINALVDEAFATFAAAAPPFNPTMRDIERNATKRILREFVANDLADLRDSGFRPKHFEWRFGPSRHGVSNHPEPFVMQFANPNALAALELSVSGTIDRIDVRPSGYRIVDYKGGKATRHKELAKKIDRGVRLQLAVYAMAVAQFFDADAKDVSGAIKPLVVADTPARKFAFELADKEAALRETLDLFVTSIVDGVFPAFPADDDADFNACKYCPVNHSCRTRHNFTEKYAIARHGEPRTLLGGND